METNIDADKATQIARKFLQDNYGNIGMLLYRIESVEPNKEKTIYKVLCSILPNIGASERIFYFLRINIAKGTIEDAFVGKEEIRNDEKVIVLEKRIIKDGKEEEIPKE